MWVLAALSGLLALSCVALATWAYLSPSDGTDYAGMVFGSAVIFGLPVLVVTAALIVAAFVMRSHRLASNRPAPAGWYAEPTSTTGLRYWDGQAWTDRTADA